MEDSLESIDDFCQSDREEESCTLSPYIRDFMQVMNTIVTYKDGHWMMDRFLGNEETSKSLFEWMRGLCKIYFADEKGRTGCKYCS